MNLSSDPINTLENLIAKNKTKIYKYLKRTTIEISKPSQISNKYKYVGLN